MTGPELLVKAQKLSKRSCATRNSATHNSSTENSVYVKMRSVGFSLLFFCAFCGGTTQPANALVAPKVEQARLDNGLQIIVIPDHRAPVVTHMVWYRVGSADEPAGKSGIAHFFEHLMFRGTATFPDGTFSKTVAALGGQDNAFTSYDYTAYFQRIAADKIETVMAMEADRMRNLIVNAELVAIERDVILEERAQRVDTNPGALLSEKLRAKLHAGAPYSVPVIGWRREIEQLNDADASAFYARYYAPDNAILVVAGDTSLADILPLARKYYGPIAPSNTPRDMRTIPESLQVTDAETPVTFRDARVTQPLWQRIYKLPTYTDATARQFAALDLLSEILGDRALGRLNKSLVVDEGISSATGSWSDSLRIDNGEFAIYATLELTGTMAQIETRVNAEILRLKNELVAESDLARARTQLVADTVYARDSQQSMARIFGEAAALGLSPDTVRDWPNLLADITAQEVRDAARLFLNPAHSVTGHLLENGS